MLTYRALKSKGKLMRKSTQNDDLVMKLSLKNTDKNDPLVEAKPKVKEKNRKSLKRNRSLGNPSNLSLSIRIREFKLIKIIRLNCALFLIAWLPYAFITLYAQFGSSKESYITPLSTSIPSLMAKLSSIYNPIIYVMTSHDCKKYILMKLTRK